MCDGAEFELGADFPSVTSSYPSFLLPLPMTGLFLFHFVWFWLILFSLLPGDPTVTKSQSGASGKDPGLEELEEYHEAWLCCVTLESSQCFSGLLPTRTKWEEIPWEGMGLNIHTRSCSHQAPVFLLWTFPWPPRVPVSWAGSHPSRGLCRRTCHHRQFWASARLFHL